MDSEKMDRAITQIEKTIENNNNKLIEKYDSK